MTLSVEAPNATVPVAPDNVKLLATIEVPKSASLKVPLMTEFLGTPTAPLKGLTAVTVGKIITSTDSVAVTPRLLVTVNLKVVVDVGETDAGVLEAKAPTALSILAAPPAKTAVKSTACPAVIVPAADTKLVISAEVTTVTVTEDVTAVPNPLVAVKV